MVSEACEGHTLEMLYEGISHTPKSDISTLAAICNNLSIFTTEELPSAVKEEITNATMRALHYDKTQFANLIAVVEDLKGDAEKFMYHVI